MDWFDRDRLNARLIPSSQAKKPTGCRDLLITLLIVVVVFLIVAVASGWVHITRIAP